MKPLSFYRFQMAYSWIDRLVAVEKLDSHKVKIEFEDEKPDGLSTITEKKLNISLLDQKGQGLHQIQYNFKRNNFYFLHEGEFILIIQNDRIKKWPHEVLHIYQG